MADRSGVDVFIPCYNYGRFLPSAVACVLEQDGPPARILIIDDASSDETARVGSELAARHAEVSFRRHERNAGHIETYNEGIAWAERAYFQFLSADDLLAPGALARAVAFFDANPDVGLVYGRTPTFSGAAPSRADNADSYASQVVDGLEFLRSTVAHGGNPIANPAGVLVRTSLQHQIGGYRHDLPHSGDMEMWLRFAVHAPVGHLDVDQGFYRRHSNNMSLEYQDLADLRQRLMAFESLCVNYAHRIPDHADIIRTARQRIAHSAFWAADAAFMRGADASADTFLAFARSIDPELPQSRAWRRLRVKKLLGHRLVGYAKSLKGAAAWSGRQ
jgi:hypothetical protein